MITRVKSVDEEAGMFKSHWISRKLSTIIRLCNESVKIQ